MPQTLSPWRRIMILRAPLVSKNWITIHPTEVALIFRAISLRFRFLGTLVTTTFPGQSWNALPQAHPAASLHAIGDDRLRWRSHLFGIGTGGSPRRRFIGKPSQFNWFCKIFTQITARRWTFTVITTHFFNFLAFFHGLRQCLMDCTSLRRPQWPER